MELLINYANDTVNNLICTQMVVGREILESCYDNCNIRNNTPIFNHDECERIKVACNIMLQLNFYVWTKNIKKNILSNVASVKNFNEKTFKGKCQVEPWNILSMFHNSMFSMFYNSMFAMRKIMKHWNLLKHWLFVPLTLYAQLDCIIRSSWN